jgi:uncharacterized protein (DUF1800 family)
MIEAIEQWTGKDAWEAYVPGAERPWTTAEVGHLLRRTCFGASAAQLEAGTKIAPSELVARVVEGRSVVGGKAASLEAFQAELDLLRPAPGTLSLGDLTVAQGLWMYRMLYSPHPFLEKLSLFWHNHFATSGAKVRDGRQMEAQIDFLRSHALAKFGTLLEGITFDPAMLVWLDAASNRRGRPNENFARELMELFSLGVGNYTEKDIQEAARALTGWSATESKANFSKHEFDAGSKTIFGQTGPFGAKEAVRLCVEHPACPRFLIGKLYREFFDDTQPCPEKFLTALAEEFRRRDLDLDWLVRTMLASRLFFHPSMRWRKVKGPCDFLVGIVRTLEGRVGPEQLVKAAAQLGQNLYYPPSVKGWDGGAEWINSNSLLRRNNMAFEATRGTNAAARLDPARLVPVDPLPSAEEIVGQFLRLFFQAEPTDVLRTIAAEAGRTGAAGEFILAPARRIAAMSRTAAHLCMTLPEFQLC